MSEETSTAVELQKLEGKIDRVLDAQVRQGQDLQFVRDVQEKQREQLSGLTGLNIQDRFVSNSTEHAGLETRVKALELLSAANHGERKGVEVSAKVVYSWLALGGVGFIAVIVRFFATGSL